MKVVNNARSWVKAKFQKGMGLLGKTTDPNMWILSTAPAPPNSRKVYGENEFQFGQIYLPQQLPTNPLPLIIALHGGFWRARYDLTHWGHAAIALADRGAAVWVPEYRRIGNTGGGYPGTLEDAATATDFARQLAKEYNLDLTRTVITGHSAGGHLALWLAARSKFPPDNPFFTLDPLPVRGVVALAPVTDLRLAWEQKLSENVVESLMGGSPQDLPTQYQAASPIEWLPLAVPTVLLHGDRDPNVPISQSQHYRDKAQAARGEVELITLPGANHFEVVNPRSPEFKKVSDYIFRLLHA